jgi:adenylate cyclase
MMDNTDAAHDAMIEEFWRSWFTDGPPPSKTRRRHFFQLLPSESRCNFCMAPFEGSSGFLVRSIFNVYRSRFNPHYCNTCDDFANKYQGGAEVPVTMLFADIRGSTTLAESIRPIELSTLINRFYVESVHILAQGGAMIEKLAGDEVTAAFTRGLSGEEYQLHAIETAKELLRATGHGDPQGPWAPLGIGIHSGMAFIGSVGRPNGIMEVATLGDVPNTASRLTSQAAVGEILVSRDTLAAAGINSDGLEKRHLELKGRNQAIDAYVLQIG